MMPFASRPRVWTTVLALATLMPCTLPAQDTTSADSAARQRQDSMARSIQRLAPVVTVSRDVGRSVLDLPYAITSVRPDSARPGQQHLAADQTLFGLPGVVVANRTNPSQDVRIAVRGFGSRSSFGVRSVRILRDGMPLTNADGQTPLDYLDLESVGRIEVIRGTASSLYGNASGGVIDIRSADAPADPFAVQLRSQGGNYETSRFTGVVGGSFTNGSYEANVGHTSTNNYREYSAQRLTNGYARTTYTAGGTDFELQAMGIDEPTAQNPGALTKAQADSAPWMADPSQVRKKARKEVSMAQAGLSARHALMGTGEIFAQLYGGGRSLYNPLTFAIVKVNRGQWGGGARATAPLTLFGLANRASIGVDVQGVSDHRFNWANCNGLAAPTASCVDLGTEQGARSLDQQEKVSSIGPYVRDELEFGGRYTLSAGIRADYVKFEVDDNFPVSVSNPDDSGKRTLHAWSPMVGLVAKLTPVHSLYANVSRAFETPTTTELGNQADGSGGFNPDLQPQLSTTYELGLKGIMLGRVQYDLAGFDTEVHDELIAFEVPDGNGRTYYRNAGRTRREGIEAELMTDVDAFTLTASYTYSHFRFRDYLVDSSNFVGNTIPGIPAHQVQASATYHYRTLFATVEGQGKSAQYVDDRNSAKASGYAIMNLRAGGTALFGRPWLAPSVGVQNIFDTHYVASVAINAAAGKYYETSPGRAVYVQLTAAFGH
ncbi:MAG: TonB-dependent receptor [Gemmatimonadaceae bacterium]|nr:TonB-dependent receptor [Gemmatimonadaceae bacterium]